MTVAIIIPARYASSRFPGKPLAELRGADGVARSLIRRSWDAARSVPDIDRVIVATDDTRIAEHAEGFGAEVAMTASDLRNGTERCAAALEGLDPTPDVVVNLQGDAPLTPPDFVAGLVAAMRDRSDVAVATPVLRCDAQSLERFREDRRAGRVGATTAVFRRDGRALYFSKEIIPYSDGPDADFAAVFHHVGLYAYRPDALAAFRALPEGRLETREGLEQLRFLEHGFDILCVEMESRSRTFWEINNPVDIARVEAALASAP